MNSFRVFVFAKVSNNPIIPLGQKIQRALVTMQHSAHASHLLYISLPSCK